VKADFHGTKKAGKKPNPAKQPFAQLSEKFGKREKSLNSLPAMVLCEGPLLN
jgi:hypothetical protein